MPRPASGRHSQGGLVPCNTCGRTFLPDVLSRHQGICVKVFDKKRRVFESGRQRVAGTGISITKIVKPEQVKKQGIKKTRWREKHQDFINAIRSARQAQHAVRTGKPLPPPPAPSINPDYIQCPHCSRRFNQTAAARHINFCGERTNTFGAPVKPLHKRAAADVHGSRVAARKAYDNIIVRRKPAANPFAYAQDGNEGVEVYSAAYGGSGPERGSYLPAKTKTTSPKRSINSPRQPPGHKASSSRLAPSPRQQQQPSPRLQPSPRQQQRRSPRYKSHSRADTASPAGLRPSHNKVQSSFPPARGPLPPATSRHRTSSLDLSQSGQSSLSSLGQNSRLSSGQNHQQSSWQPSPPRQTPSYPPEELSQLSLNSERPSPEQLSSLSLKNSRRANIAPSPSLSSERRSSTDQLATSGISPVGAKNSGKPKMVPPPPLPGKLLPWQEAIVQSSTGSPPRSTALPNGHIRRSRLVKSGRPRGSVRFAENVQVKTFGDTFPGPEDSDIGGPQDFAAGLPRSDYAGDGAMTNYFDEHGLSKHTDLMSVLKSNYGSDVMLATPGNHIEEMMNSRHPVHPLPPNYDSLADMGLLTGSNVSRGVAGTTRPDLSPQSMGLGSQRGAGSQPSNPFMKTSYQDAFGRSDYQSFESTTPLDLGHASGSLSSHHATSQSGPPAVGRGYGGRPRPLGGSLRGPPSTKPIASDFSKLSISGNTGQLM